MVLTLSGSQIEWKGPDGCLVLAVWLCVDCEVHHLFVHLHAACMDHGHGLGLDVGSRTKRVSPILYTCRGALHVRAFYRACVF